jgi:hypothetical protein
VPMPQLQLVVVAAAEASFGRHHHRRHGKDRLYPISHPSCSASERGGMMTHEGNHKDIGNCELVCDVSARDTQNPVPYCFRIWCTKMGAAK